MIHKRIFWREKGQERLSQLGNHEGVFLTHKERKKNNRSPLKKKKIKIRRSSAAARCSLHQLRRRRHIVWKWPLHLSEKITCGELESTQSKSAFSLCTQCTVGMSFESSFMGSLRIKAKLFKMVQYDLNLPTRMMWRMSFLALKEFHAVC